MKISMKTAFVISKHIKEKDLVVMKTSNDRTTCEIDYRLKKDLLTSITEKKETTETFLGLSHNELKHYSDNVRTVALNYDNIPWDHVWPLSSLDLTQAEQSMEVFLHKNPQVFEDKIFSKGSNKTRKKRQSESADPAKALGPSDILDGNAVVDISDRWSFLCLCVHTDL